MLDAYKKFNVFITDSKWWYCHPTKKHVLLPSLLSTIPLYTLRTAFITSSRSFVVVRIVFISLSS